MKFHGGLYNPNDLPGCDDCSSLQCTPDLYAEMQSSTQQKMDKKCNYFPKVQQIGIISVAVHYPNWCWAGMERPLSFSLLHPSHSCIHRSHMHHPLLQPRNHELWQPCNPSFGYLLYNHQQHQPSRLQVAKAKSSRWSPTRSVVPCHRSHSNFTS